MRYGSFPLDCRRWSYSRILMFVYGDRTSQLGSVQVIFIVSVVKVTTNEQRFINENSFDSFSVQINLSFLFAANQNVWKHFD